MRNTFSSQVKLTFWTDLLLNVISGNCFAFRKSGLLISLSISRQQEVLRHAPGPRLKDLDRLYATIKSEHGHIDILFANADLSNVTLFGQVTEENFDLHFNVNVKGLSSRCRKRCR